jgi:sirohydrochlorin cobaltochelatase
MSAEFPLIQPAVSESSCQHEIRCTMGATIRKATGLQLSDRQCPGWLGVDCPDVRTAIWMMRALVASNILSRREGAILFVPVNPVTDRTGDVVSQTAVRVHGFMNGR